MSDYIIVAKNALVAKSEIISVCLKLKTVSVYLKNSNHDIEVVGNEEEGAKLLFDGICERLMYNRV